MDLPLELLTVILVASAFLIWNFRDKLTKKRHANQQAQGAAQAAPGQQTPPTQNQPQQQKKGWTESGKEWGSWSGKWILILAGIVAVVFFLGILFDFWDSPKQTTWNAVRDQWEENFGWITYKYVLVTSVILLFMYPFLPKGEK